MNSASQAKVARMLTGLKRVWSSQLPVLLVSSIFVLIMVRKTAFRSVTSQSVCPVPLIQSMAAVLHGVHESFSNISLTGINSKIL